MALLRHLNLDRMVAPDGFQRMYEICMEIDFTSRQCFSGSRTSRSILVWKLTWFAHEFEGKRSPGLPLNPLRVSITRVSNFGFEELSFITTFVTVPSFETVKVTVQGRVTDASVMPISSAFRAMSGGSINSNEDRKPHNASIGFGFSKIKGSSVPLDFFDSDFLNVLKVILKAYAMFLAKRTSMHIDGNCLPPCDAFIPSKI